jgi:AcrR family transcriptional regulator
MVDREATTVDQPSPSASIVKDASSDGLSARKQVADIQRARMLSAMVELAAERGAAATAVAHVITRSGVSRRTFYEIFEDREDCFVAAFDDAVERILEVVAPAYVDGHKWQEKIRGGLTALLEFCEREPRVGRLVFVDSLAAEPRVLEMRRSVVSVAIGVVDSGRDEIRGGSEPPPLTAEGIVGSVVSVIQSRLLDRQSDQLLALVNPLMSMIVLPYLGRAASNRELKQVVQEVPKPTIPRAESSLLREIGMRLTYRTVRVLEAVAEHPNGSNRQIGDSSGIADQGQISKLLTRLEGFGLVENLGGDLARGAPNAWLLSEKGRELHGAISQPTHGL